MRTKTSRVILFFFLVTSLLYSGQKAKEKDLPHKYQEWLKLTRYIILEKEKEVFMELTSNFERDAFMETFWKQRDPTAGTPQNEYLDEILERFLYVNKHFSRGTTREGWMTDMGRFYMILGPPVSIDRFPAPHEVYPAEVWSYYGNPAKGLPPHFVLVFFQRGGFGEFKLYSPISDGPSSLLIQGRSMDPFNYEALYQKIFEAAPDLAPVCLSMVPGDIPFNFQPSMTNVTILANIIESPKKMIDPSYSTHFLNLRGVVDYEYLTNYIQSTTDIALIKDPITGINFLHFSIAPDSISIDFYVPSDQYFCNYTLNVSLRQNEDAIFQYTKTYALYFASDELNKVRASGISIEDSFPVVEGRYKLDILLQNSVGKEYCHFEKTVIIPEESELPRVYGPFLGYNFHDYDTNQHIPYKVVNKKLLVDPKKTFSKSDTIALLFNLTNITENLWKTGEVKVNINGMRARNPLKKSFNLKLSNYPFRKMLSIQHSIPANEFTPDYYEMELNFVDENGETIDIRRGEFIIGLEEAIPHPIARAKAFPLVNNFLHFYMLAYQYDKVKDYVKAEEHYERAYNLNVDYKKGILEYANFLLKVKKFDRSLELIENVKEEERLIFDYYLVKGRAYMGLAQYAEAIESLLEGNKIYNSDTNLLNSLGFCFYKTNQKDKALNVLKASLRLNQNQENIQKLIEEIEKDLNT
jgi:GWxTD domain-containing protein